MKTLTTVLIFLLVASFNPSPAQTLPSGFTAVQVAAGILKPVGMTFTPDGRIFVLEQNGGVRVVKNGTLLPTPLIKLKVNARGEGGLIGIVLDPNFSVNQYFYLYYSIPEGTRNRISRFECNGDIAALSTEQIILNLDTRTSSIHHGGAMHFKGGKLFVAIGDDSNGANAQNPDTYHGKIIRINPDGSIPSGNPYTSGSEQRRRTWAHGVRNPFTFAVQPGTGKIFVNDVGLKRAEEINDVTLPGKNYGWPEAEGTSTNSAFVNPVYAYQHGLLNEFGCAIAGGSFFNPAQTTYPAGYIGRYFFQDYCGQWIKTLDISTSPVRVEPFATGIGADALYLTTGNDGNLYYVTRSTGSLYKIVYTSEEAPQIWKQPSAISVPMGQPASFSVTASGKSPLMYQWRKNGVAIAGATASTFTIPQTTTSDGGSYSVRVFNAIGSVLSNSVQLTITAMNHRPVAQILQPTAGSLYGGGDVISFSGTATDEEDGALAAARFTWLADFHHDTHSHDGPPVASGTKSGSFTIPTRGETSDNVWYRLYLIVTDSQGLADTASVDIYPRKSTLKLTTEPAGLKVKLDGQPMDAPFSVVSVENIERSIGAVTPQLFNGKSYAFQKWLHGGTETQTIFTPVDDVTYTAVYVETIGSPLRREVWTGIPGTHISSIPVDSPPDQVTSLLNFESPSNAGDYYGSRIRALISPPVSGNYVFWISGNDRTELWLSADGDPSTKKRIAYTEGYTYVREWTRYPTQQSVPIALVANQKYYIEALHKELEGSDHVAVGWQLPGGTLERPIGGIRLSSYPGINKVPLINITAPPNNGSFSAPASVNIAATASDNDGSIARVEFYNGTTKLGEDITAPYTFSWSNVSAGSYTLSAKATDNSGATSSSSVAIVVTGAITHEVWLGIPGSKISSIPQDSKPTSTGILKIFEAPANAGDYYGRRIRGFIYPPATGNYVFWISGNDRTELWLSTDANPSNKRKIAYTDGYTYAREWTRYPTQQSIAIALVAKQKYYIEALHKELEGSDHVAVGWQLPGGTLQRPIPGIRLLPVSHQEDQIMAGSITQASPSLTVAGELTIAEEIVLHENGMHIYPNPVSAGRAEIVLPEFEGAGNTFQTAIHIRGITGKIVYSVSYISDAYVRRYSIPLDELAPGVYLVTVSNNNRSFSKRLTIH